MKTLVTGATGLIGSVLVRELLKDNTEIKVMVREKSDTRNIDGLEVEKVYGDIRDTERIKSALKGCDVFYQMAALYSLTGPDRLFYDINVEGTKSALNAALQMGTQKVVYTSSVAAVGMSNDPSKILNENAPFNMWNMGPYIRTKNLGEQAALEIAGKGLPLVIVNPATVIGIYDIKPTPSGQIILDILNKKTPGYTEGGGNYVDVEDVARGHILAAKKGRVGERYILGNANLTLKDFFDLVSEISGISVPNRKYSKTMVISLGYLMQLISLFTRKPPVVSPTSARVASSYFYFDSSKAVKELGFPQTSVKTTIIKAINWFKENGYVNG